MRKAISTSCAVLLTEESAHLAAPGRGPRCGRILIMDDDRMVRETMHRQLAICGYEVAETSCGEEAVNGYRQAREEGRPFDAVVLDLKVNTGWGGEQALDELLKLDPGVKALLCSGSLAAPKAHYEKRGFRGVLGKPYSLANLRGELEAVLHADRNGMTQNCQPLAPQPTVRSTPTQSGGRGEEAHPTPERE